MRDAALYVVAGGLASAPLWAFVQFAWSRVFPSARDLSFPLYLVHLPVLTLAPGPMWARVAASCVAACALWWALDRHCTRGLAGLGLRTRRAVVA